MKTSELTGAALDWAVAKCLNITPIAVKKKYSKGYILYSLPASTVPLEYSSRWAQGGPIIEREKIDVIADPNGKDVWMGQLYLNWGRYEAFAETPLIAAMRCYVASKLGDEVEVPDDLH
jgi:hypothetical protein